MLNPAASRAIWRRSGIVEILVDDAGTMPALPGDSSAPMTSLNLGGVNDAWERWLPAGCAESSRPRSTVMPARCRRSRARFIHSDNFAESESDSDRFVFVDSSGGPACASLVESPAWAARRSSEWGIVTTNSLGVGGDRVMALPALPPPGAGHISTPGFAVGRRFVGPGGAVGDAE